MKLVVGLGNPGKQYEQTRHNIGFALVKELTNAQFQEKPKFKALIAETYIENEKVLLIKPATFYNLVGESVRAIRDFYKLENSDILAIHDDMALPFGTIRTRFGGRDAGNNGIKSLNQHLGFDYARARIGVWNNQRETVDAHNFVLGKFSKEDQELIENKIEPAVKSIVNEYVNDTLEAHSVNLMGVAEAEDILEQKRNHADSNDTDNQ